MSKKYVYDYYEISIPGDAFETMEDACDCAINEARDRARLYCMPCMWSAWPIRGEIGSWEIIFKVSRKRNRIAKVINEA